MAAPAKGVLRSRPSDADRSRHEAHIRWNEANLQQNEDEKVPRMKIDQPKTPFHRLQPQEGDGDAVSVSSLSPRSPRSPGRPAQETPTLDSEKIAQEALRRREDEAAGSDHSLNSSGTFGELDEDELDPEVARRRAEFERKRKQHYRVIDKLRRQASAMEDEDEDESDSEAARPPDDGKSPDAAGGATSSDAAIAASASAAKSDAHSQQARGVPQ